MLIQLEIAADEAPLDESDFAEPVSAQIGSDVVASKLDEPRPEPIRIEGSSSKTHILIPADKN